MKVYYEVYSRNNTLLSSHSGRGSKQKAIKYCDNENHSYVVKVIEHDNGDFEYSGAIYNND